MSMARAVWEAHIRAIGNALQGERRMQISWGTALVFDLVAGIWSFNILHSNVLVWQRAGIDILDQRLWILCLSAWFGLGILAVLTFLQKIFGTDEPVFLLTFPIPPATFFRVFYMIVLIEGSGNWLISTSLIIGIALAGALGWPALIWVFLFLMGSAVITFFSMLLTLVVLRYVQSYLKIMLIGVGVLVAGVALLFILVRLGWVAMPVFTQISIQPKFSSQGVPIELEAGLCCLGILVLQLGLFSRWAGNLHIGLFQSAQNQFSTRNYTRSLWVAAIEAVLGRFRTILGAMLFKGVLNQSRSLLTWLRLGVIGVLLALFVPIQTALAPYHIMPPVFVIGYASTIGFLLILEVGLNAIGGEGDRFTWYLLMPITLRDVLLAKWVLFLIPTLTLSLLTSLVCSILLGLSPIQNLLITLDAVLLVSGSVTLLTLGSAYDEDLNLSIEGWMQAILYEELPASPRRLLLFNASLIFHAALILLVTVFPLWLSPVILVLIDGVLLAVLLSGSSTYLTKLLDKG